MPVASPKSSITWFYYDGLTEAATFYGKTLGLEQVLDAGWAQIYRIPGNAFVGLVDASAGKGTCQTQETNAVLLTFVVDDVPAWFEKLQSAGEPLRGEITVMEDVQIRTFFLSDPGGYSIEFQEFLDPKVRSTFQ